MSGYGEFPLTKIWSNISPKKKVLFLAITTHATSDLFFAILVPVLPLIKADLNLSYTEAVLVKVLFTGASAVFQIPMGLLAELFSGSWLILIGNIWVAGGVILMTFAPSVLTLLVITFFAGLGGGAQHPVAANLVSNAYESGGRSTAMGTFNFSGDIGKMLAPAIVALLVMFGFGWKTMLWSVGVSGIVIMVGVKLIFTGTYHQGINQKKGLSTTKIDTEYQGFMKLSVVGFLDSAIRASALVFLPFELYQNGFTITVTSLLVALLFVGGAFGKFVCGWLGDQYGLINITMVTKCVTAGLLLALVFAPAYIMGPLVLLLGFNLQGTSSVLYAAVAEFVTPEKRGRLYGFYYTVIDGGAVIAPLTFGLVADLYSLNDAIFVMSLTTIAILPASMTLRKYIK